MRLRQLDAEGLTWIEEPVLAHDYAGFADLARKTTTALQAGENWWGPLDFRHAFNAGVRELVMPDVMKCRRRHRLAARGRHGAGVWHAAVQPPLAGDQQPWAAACHAHCRRGRLVAGICGLVEPDPERPAAHPEGLPDATGVLGWVSNSMNLPCKGTSHDALWTPSC